MVEVERELLEPVWAEASGRHAGGRRDGSDRGRADAAAVPRARPRERGRPASGAEARAACDDVAFLVATDDWPQQLYRKLGFAGAGSIWQFLRPPTWVRRDETRPAAPFA